MAEPSGPAPSTQRVGLRGRLVAITRRVPPARMLWILLLVLAAYGLWFLGTGIGLATAVGLPILAVVADLAFQRIRFERIRFPDAAIATGLFLALLLPPVVPAIAAAAPTLPTLTQCTALIRGEAARPMHAEPRAGSGSLTCGAAPPPPTNVNRLVLKMKLKISRTIAPPIPMCMPPN